MSPLPVHDCQASPLFIARWNTNADNYLMPIYGGCERKKLRNLMRPSKEDAMQEVAHRKQPVVGMIGIILGAAALLLAIVHFWGGPFTEQPSLETTVAQKAVAIRDATIAALKGEDTTPAPIADTSSRWDLDRVSRVATGVMAGLAIILAVVSLALHEPLRVAAGGVILGSAALAFQFVILAIGAILIATLIAAVLGELSFE